MVIALVAAINISGATTPFYLGKHGFGKGRVRLAYGDVATGVVIAKCTCKFHNGQPSEGNVANHDAVTTHHSHDGILLTALNAGEHIRIAALQLAVLDEKADDRLIEADNSLKVTTEL